MTTTAFWAQVVAGLPDDVEVISLDVEAIVNDENERTGMLVRVPDDDSPIRFSGWTLGQRARYTPAASPAAMAAYVADWARLIVDGRRAVRAEGTT